MDVTPSSNKDLYIERERCADFFLIVKNKAANNTGDQKASMGDKLIDSLRTKSRL